MAESSTKRRETSNKIQEATNLAKLRAFYADNFFAFCEQILGYGRLRFAPHWELCDFLVNSPGDGSNRTSNISTLPLKCGRHHLPDKKRKFIAVPRGAFKTTIISVSYVVWRLCQDPTIRVLIAHHTQEKACDIVREIAGHFSANKKLRALYGDLGYASHGGGGIWKKDQLQLWNPETGAFFPFRNMPSIRAIGVESAIAGLHPDLVICDDLVNNNTIANIDQLEKTQRFIKYIEPLMLGGTEIIVTGTRYDFRDAYGWIINQLDTYDIYLRSAVNGDDTLWFPAEQTWDFLKAQEQVLGTYFFSCQYLMNPVHPEDAVFKEAWIQGCLCKEITVSRETLEVSQWTDPAASTGRKSDNTANLTVGMDPQGIMWVLNSGARKISDEAMIDWMLTNYEQWGATELHCEEQVAFALIQPLLRRMAADRNISINYVPFKQSTVKSKDFRIRALMPLIQSGRIRIPEDQSELLGELRRYPKDKDDLIDALATAVANLCPKVIPRMIDLGTAMKEYKEKMDRDWPLPAADSSRDFFVNVFGG
jgi:phage terminase large subunit-like protein